MPDDAPPLRPADRAGLLYSLSYALRYGRTANQQQRDDLIARLAAEQVLAHLEGSNYVVMQRPPARVPSIGFPSNPHPDGLSAWATSWMRWPGWRAWPRRAACPAM